MAKTSMNNVYRTSRCRQTLSPRGALVALSAVGSLAGCTLALDDEGIVVCDYESSDGCDDARSIPEGFRPEWSLVMIPDTQVYSYTMPEIFDAQTRWTAENDEALNIRFVLHVGDVTEWNLGWEWENASASMQKLEGIVPYAVVPGNHDYDPDRERDSRMSEYFTPERLQRQPTFGGLFDDASSENSFHLFDAGGERWLVVALEWGPRDEVLSWAGDVLDAYSDRQAIILTHAYLYYDSTRYHWADRGEEQDWNPHRYPRARWPEVNDGQEIWEKLLVHRPNVRYVFSGHVLGEGVGRLTNYGPAGNRVDQVVANYQHRDLGGAGFLRLIQFGEQGVAVRTYSPYLDAYMTDEQNEFFWPRHSMPNAWVERGELAAAEPGHK